MKLSDKNTHRLYTLDVVKGLAVCGMVLYHLLFDLSFFTPFTLDVTFWPIALLGAIVRLLFVGGVGVSLFMLFSKSNSFKVFAQKTTLKASKLGLLALSISLLTFFLFPESFIRFGVIHLISISMIFAVPFVQKPTLSLLCGLSISLFGFSFMPLQTTIPHIWWLGFSNQQLTDLDYFPLIPWFGIVLIGIWIGSIWLDIIEPILLRINNKSNLTLAILGKNSLLIYLLHQPILLALLALASYFVSLQSS